MRRVLLAGVLLLTLSACGSYGGGTAPGPAGGGAATDAPNATPSPAKTPGASGDPDVDDYGY
ncbi:MAG: hypothetical protein Q7S41_00135 [Candidatus Limnocylindria bacterium]|nr:hypothetical protein [Candidatus Limnocylindria bacterium]